MKRVVDSENKIVFFEGDWPTVMGIPSIMKKYYPGYVHKVVSRDEFQKLKENL